MEDKKIRRYTAWYCNAVNKLSTIDWWTKGNILAFLKKGDLGITKNYRDITLTPTTSKIYNALLLNRIEVKIEKILWKN